MIDLLPTSRAPLPGFVDKLMALEEDGAALSISAIHDFMAGDSPDLGAKIIVVSDGDKPGGDALAHDPGMELFSFRGTTKPEFLAVADALAQARDAKAGPVVIADVWDNPGGGVAGDSTILLRTAIEMNMTSIALGTIWDPMAVRLCHAAGEGAVMDLRFGGKTSAFAGAPIDATVTVVKTACNAVQSFGTSVVPLGDCSMIRVSDIEVVLNPNRSQAFSPDLFTNLGIDIKTHKLPMIAKRQVQAGTIGITCQKISEAEAKTLIEASGLDVPVISNGGSPGMWQAQDVPVATEYRFDTYVFNDSSLQDRSACTWDDCALSVLVTVVSVPTSNRAVVMPAPRS